jgi:serine/threonine protein kinase
MSSQKDSDVLLRIQQMREQDEFSPEQLVQYMAPNASSHFQLKLVALDIEIRLQCGDRINPDLYLLEYPCLGEQIYPLYREVKKEFLETYCPVRRGKLEFPCSLGQYVVHEEIGRGGMGVVYRGMNTKTGAEVAIKVNFIPETVEVEADALRRLDHPSICNLHEVGEEDKVRFLVMDLIDGINLKSHLEGVQKFEPRAATRIVLQAAQGLFSAHEKGIVHLDVKTSNLILSSAGTIKLLDFGLATSLDKFRDWGGVDAITFGTPAYLPPEFFKSEFGKPGCATDIYGLGVVLFELLTGTVPFLGDYKSLPQQICDHPPCRPSDFPDSRVDEFLETICLKALAKHVCDRYSSMGDFVSDLEQWIAETQPTNPALASSED